QRGRARARQQVAAGIGRMADADMAEGVEHALMAENAVGDGKLVTRFGECIGHGRSLRLGCDGPQESERRPLRQAARSVVRADWLYCVIARVATRILDAAGLLWAARAVAPARRLRSGKRQRSKQDRAYRKFPQKRWMRSQA